MGSDPDADEAELFHPDFCTDGADAGAWVDPPVAWREARVLRAEDDLGTTETYGAVDPALAELDPIDVGLVIRRRRRGAIQPGLLELDLPSGEVRKRLARARFAVRAALDRDLRS